MVGACSEGALEESICDHVFVIWSDGSDRPAAVALQSGARNKNRARGQGVIVRNQLRSFIRSSMTAAGFLDVLRDQLRQKDEHDLWVFIDASCFKSKYYGKK